MDNVTTKHNDTSVDTYDRGIVPAETAARMEREGDLYKSKPEDSGHSDTTSGYTHDSEGLLNNYAIEPEMYVEGEEPDPLKEKVQEAREEKIERDAAQGLAEPMFGFTVNAERMNGRFAMLGFTIGILTELLTGQGILSQIGLM